MVDNDGRRGGRGNKCSATDLEVGQHSLRIEFFRADGQAYITASYRSRNLHFYTHTHFFLPAQTSRDPLF